MNQLPPSNFSFRDWEENTSQALYEVPDLNKLPNLPKRSDHYQPGHIKWGSNPKRGRGLQASRMRKRLEANKAQFLSEVMPLIADQLNAAAWKDLAQTFADDAFYTRGGFTRYVLGEKSAWVHSTETDKIAQCEAMGAKPEAQT